MWCPAQRPILAMAILCAAPAAARDARAIMQDPGPGISQTLAKARAEQLTVRRYDLVFHLAADCDTVRGEVTIRFDLAQDEDPNADVVVDFAGKKLSEIAVNGVPPGDSGRSADGHWIIGADLLVRGGNTFRAEFESAVAPTGTPLTVYRDRDRGESYYYTLLVPADAHGLFPCFDQPDLKAPYRLELHCPDGWQAVGNAPLAREPEGSDQGTVWTFRETEALPTYLFAFAAGPFEVIERSSAEARIPMRALVRRSERRHADFDRLFSLHEQSLRWQEDWFGIPYPFAKLDFALLPGFPYGGMEHAGAIFYRETALAFDHPPTASELLSRSTLIYHEVCHQWFGNLVTMRWFDDLWLKEGFANLVAYLQLEALEPELAAWRRFHQRIRPSAYAVDETSGTVPIYQELANLNDAKSNYGPIVYDKAPAVLRALQLALGESFRDGVRAFLEAHPYGNADWRDLIGALATASGQSLDRWSDRWILSAGMPRAQVEVDLEDGTVSRCEVIQRRAGSAANNTETWPLTLRLLIVTADGSRRTETVAMDGRRHSIDSLIGAPAPAAVLLNADDGAYGSFALDATSREWWLEHVATEPDPLVRSVALTALWTGVRDAELAPERFATVLADLLKAESDPLERASFLGRLGVCVSRYLPTDARSELQARLAGQLLPILESDRTQLKLQAFRFLTYHCSDVADVRVFCRAALRGESSWQLPGLEDRYRAWSTLLAHGEGEEFESALTGNGQPAGGERHAFRALAAGPDATTKERYFKAYGERDRIPEQWISRSLTTFHWPGQSRQTLPYLARALQQVDWVKANRRIFFMPAWVNSFIQAHTTQDALDIVDRFLREHELSIDIRRKILQARDQLARTVRIRARFG